MRPQPLGCVILPARRISSLAGGSETISHPTRERKPQAKAFGYRFFSKESLNLGKSYHSHKILVNSCHTGRRVDNPSTYLIVYNGVIPMFNKFVKIFSLILLLSITLSFSILKGQDQSRGRIRSPEIVFFGKEETKWTEEREIPRPTLAAQGIKEEPAAGSFDLREDQIGPMRKMSPSTTQPGCAYTSKITRGQTTGDKAFYERGRHHYLQGNYEDAIHLFRRLIEEHPESLWRGSAIYWLGES